MHRTAEFIEETKAQSETEKTPEKKREKRLMRGGVDPAVGKATQIKPGEVRNPGGRPKRDIAADIARAVFETSESEAIVAFRAAILKGNAYTFKELAERAYGKLQERKEVTHIHQELPDPDLDKRIADLIRDLGLAKQIDEVGAAKSAGRETPTNGHAKDSEILSR